MLRKLVVLITFFVGMALCFFLAIYKSMQLPPFVEIESASFPSLGPSDAKIEFVAFEDFLCSKCKHFSETIFPQIERRYIDKKEGRYVFIPLAYLEGSDLLANAAYAVFEKNPDRFFPFAEELFIEFAGEDADKQAILDAAANVGGIDMEFLSNAMETNAFYFKINQAMKLAEKAMKGEVGVPSLFINGVRTETHSFQGIEARIQRILK